MSNVKPRDPTRNDNPAELDGNIRNLTRKQNSVLDRQDNRGEEASTIMRRLGAEATREIDQLIDGLRHLREKLEEDCNRVQRDIADYASLGQSTIEFTKIVSAGMTHVKSGSDTSSVSQEELNSRAPTVGNQEKETSELTT